jgi:PmbA protein
MSKEMFDLCEWVLDTARKAGAGDCRVRYSRNRSVSIDYRERKPETIKEAQSVRLSVEAFTDRRYASQSTSDLRRDALREFVSNTVQASRLLAEDPHRTLPDPRYYKGRADLDLKIFDDSYDRVTPEQRHAYAKAAEEACLSAGGDLVISVSSGAGDQTGESIVMTSNGLQGYSRSTSFNAGASMTARDEGDRRPQGYYYISSRMRKDMPAAESVGKQAAANTLRVLKAKKIPTETLPVIIENWGVPRVLNGFVSALFARNIQQKRSFLTEKKGERVAGDKFTLADDPHLPGGLASALFDGEGLATRRRVIVDSGILRDFYVDWYYGRKLDWEPTSGSTSNLVIPPGKRPVKEIMKDLGRGIYITEFLGGNSNSTTGDFSVGIGGILFENGVFTQPVSEMNIAGNHLTFWGKLVEVADDPWRGSSWRTPSLVFEDVVVAGV